MATDPVQFSLMMNNRPRAELDKATARNDKVFDQTMEATSMAQRAQQMQQQEEQFNIVQQLREKQFEFNKTQSMAEAALANQKFEIAKTELDRQTQDRLGLAAAASKLGTLDPGADDFGTKINEISATSNLSPQGRLQFQAMAEGTRGNWEKTKAGLSKVAIENATLSAFNKLDPADQIGVNPNDPYQVAQAAEKTRQRKMKDSIDPEQAIKAGVNPFDEEGNLRPQNDIVKDWSEASAKKKHTFGDLPDGVIKLATAQSDKFDSNQAVKDYTEALAGFSKLKKLVETPGKASAQNDMALVYAFMKAQDPGSVVRETEFATAAKTGSLGEKIKNAVTKITSGNFLTDDQRKDFLETAKTTVKGHQSAYSAIRNRYAKKAELLGVPSEIVVGEDIGSEILEDSIADKDIEDLKAKIAELGPDEFIFVNEKKYKKPKK